MVLLKPIFVGAYTENSPLFASSYSYLIPLMLSYLIYRALGGLSSSLFRTVIPMVAFELVLRVVLTALILAYYLDWFTFDTLVLLYVLAHYTPALIVMLDIRNLQLKWKVDWSIFRSKIGRLMIQFGLYSSLSEVAALLLFRLDMVLIGLFLGESEAGSYAIAIYFSSLISKPNRSIQAILAPLLATRIKERKMEEVAGLYQKTALNNLLIGGFLMILMWVNIGPFFDLLPKHRDAEIPAIILALSVLINLFSGPHRLLILNTKLFRYDLYANILLVIFALLLDWWLIPPYGLLGAAVATLIVTVVYNAAAMLYVRHHMAMIPFSRQNLLSLGLLVLILFLGLVIPTVIHPVLTMALRSGVVCGLFALIVFRLNPSPELRDLLLIPIRRFQKSRIQAK